MKRKIDFRKGSGSAILGMVLLTVCFAVALIVMEQGNLFYRASKTQMVADVIADGSTVYAQTPLGVDQAKLDQMAYALAARNDDSNVSYTLHPPIITDVLDRTDYIDKEITVHLDASTGSLVSSSGIGTTEISVGAQVRALSRLTATVQLTSEEEQIVIDALNALPADSPQYKAIIEGVKRMGWIYSQTNRWEEGYCDCSSFVIACFLGTEQNYGISGTCRTIMPIAMNNGWFSFWFPGWSDLSDLQPGDVLYWRMQYAVDEGLPYGLGHVGIYLGDGKIIHASSTAGRVVITNIFGDTWTNADGKLIGYSRQPMMTSTP